jgi:hypothetical protein
MVQFPHVTYSPSRMEKSGGDKKETHHCSQEGSLVLLYLKSRPSGSATLMVLHKEHARQRLQPIPRRNSNYVQRQYNKPKEKADLFLDRFSNEFPSNIPPKDHLEAFINRSISPSFHDALNDPITSEEQDSSLPKSKSKAVGADLVHNSMLRNLSPKNKTYLLHLVNILLSNAHVPAQWKSQSFCPSLNRARVPRTHPPTAQYLSYPV